MKFLGKKGNILKILHFSDTHLGFNDLEIINEKGINQREADFYKAFDDICEQIEKLKPDFIIHTGDLFHRSSPSNRAIAYALEKFKQIEKLNIPFILIAGNHSTPRTTTAKPILSIFDNFENVYSAYSCRYMKFEFDDIVFHAIPHLNDENSIFEQLDSCEQNINANKKNIMMLHCSVGHSYLMSEFGEFVYPKEREYLFEKMDYVALGHWHGFGSVGKHKNVFYSGSLERTSSNDKRNNKGFVLLNLENELDVKFEPIKIREFKSFIVDARSFEEDLNSIDASNINGDIVEITIDNLTALKSIDISNQRIKEYFSNALQVIVKREFIQEQSRQIDDIEAISLQDYFVEYLEESCEKDEFERLKNKANELFARYEESVDDTF